MLWTRLTRLGIALPGFWRGVNLNQNAFYLECFVDEIAAATGQDPLALRRKLMANSPKHLPPDGGGALWWLGAEALRAPGAGSPRLLRRFPGLKPEGVTLSPEGDALIIVFDRDRQQPLWLRLPLPR